jgi:hypothetical protein
MLFTGNTIHPAEVTMIGIRKEHEASKITLRQGEMPERGGKELKGGRWYETN